LEKLHKKLKICVLRLNRVRIKDRMAGNYTSFEEEGLKCKGNAGGKRIGRGPWS
jgi:hypothetical protein